MGERTTVITFGELYVRVEPSTASRACHTVRTTIIKFDATRSMRDRIVGVFEQELMLTGTLTDLLDQLETVTNAFFPETYYGELEWWWGEGATPAPVEDDRLPLRAVTVWHLLLCPPAT